MVSLKSKIFNDPIYGFISVKEELLLKIIDHPYFQRLRRIKQLGLSHLVYPGALHTRFHHALGCVFLMGEAINTLREKGVEISQEEELGVTAAILLHDIGHGPFSHALEHTLVDGVSHEDLSQIFMQKLNKEFDGELDLAIQIFNNQYHRKFLYQLISSQLDMDRLDYLRRDSFYSGVSEGVVGSERIIKMLNVKNDSLVVEQKGIYSIEKFIVARRLMYWQVYLHKTVLSAEYMLIQALKRAKELAQSGEDLFATPSLKKFLYSSFSRQEFLSDETVLNNFSELDDSDLLASFKVWVNHNDVVLSRLCKGLLNRELFKIEIGNNPIERSRIDELKLKVQECFQINHDLSDHLLLVDSETNNAYNLEKDNITILFKNGDVKNIVEASDNFNLQSLSKPVTKYFVCYPKELLKNT